MDGAYFFPSPDENELKEALKKLSVKMLSHTAIESSLTKEQVQHGIWRKGPDETRVDVTIKSVHSEESESNKKLNRSLLLQEIAIMGQFRHPNIVKLHGAVHDQTHTMLVSEYFPRGDLRKILVQMGRSVKPLDTPKLLLTYSQQVALGMQYLASKGFVHRGLCASNIFVTNIDTCKVGGFGKSRDLSDVNDYVARGGRLQVRWTAPEAMYYRQYSTASDVWSYGCLLYEIWSLGRMPFRDFSNAEVIEKVDSGYRLPPPPGCPHVIYNLMTRCWHPNPFSRPCFKEIINTLLRDEDRILQIPFKDASTHEAAIILGANLKAGAYMYSDLQLRYIKKSSDPLMNGSAQSHDYDHIEDEKFMLSFPTSSADLACETKSRREEENDEDISRGVSLVPQPSIYSRPVELSNCLPSNNFVSVQYNPYDYEDIVDF